jgi:rhomboid family GlyGly-CTERM serine protease
MAKAVRVNAVFAVSLAVAVLILVLSLPEAGFPWPPVPPAGSFSVDYGHALVVRLGQWTVLPPRLINALAYLRPLLASQPWRLLTAHSMHLNAHHALMNAAGLVMLGWYFRTDMSLRSWLGLMVTASLAISLGLWLWQPQFVGYVGLSAVLHALLYAGLIRAWREMPLLHSIALALMVGRLVWEYSPGYDPDYLMAWIHGPVAPSAHFYGAITGSLWALGGLWLERRRNGAPVAA